MYTFQSRVRYSESDSEGKLTLGALLNYFQDCSTFQSESLGVGMECLRAHHMVWVLSSWQIVVDRYPAICEDIEIGTFPYEFRNFMGSRNFFMKDASGSYVAKANSLWSLLNTDTMKPVLPPTEIIEKYELSEKLDMDYASRKIAVPEGGFLAEPVIVRKHHLDTNHHVNNGQYVNMALEYLPENLAKNGVRQLRAEYKMQAFLDDVLHPYVVEEEDGVIVSLRDEAGKPYVNVEFR